MKRQDEMEKVCFKTNSIEDVSKYEKVSQKYCMIKD